MKAQKQERRMLQWHPAFYAGFQIELQEDSLLFENKYQLGTRPKEIDVLVIKRETQKKIRKNLPLNWSNLR